MPFLLYFTCFFFQNELIAYVNQKNNKTTVFRTDFGSYNSGFSTG